MRATVSQNVPHRLRPQIPPGLGNQVPQTHTRWTGGGTRARFDTGNLRSPQHTDSPRTRLERPRACLYLHAAADFRIKNRTIPEGQDLAQAPAREPRASKTILGPASVGTGILRRVIRHHHGRNDHEVHRVAG